MGILGPSRAPRGPDPHLDLKVFLFLVGAVLAVVGMAIGQPMLVWLAFIPLAIVAVLRFFRPRA